jgi:hypothetical protein
LLVEHVLPEKDEDKSLFVQGEVAVVAADFKPDPDGWLIELVIFLEEDPGAWLVLDQLWLARRFPIFALSFVLLKGQLGHKFIWFGII